MLRCLTILASFGPVIYATGYGRQFTHDDGASTVSAYYPGESAPRIDIHHRQEQTLVLPSQTTSSSYDYWWPYPPGGVTSSATTASPTLLATDDGVLTITLTTDTPSTTDSTSASFIFTNTSISMTSTDPASSSSFSSSSTLSTTTPSTPVLSSAHSHSLSSSTYLIPISVVLGSFLTLFLLWLIYRIITARHKPRTRASASELKPGPPYAPSENDDLVDHGRSDVLRSGEEKSGIGQRGRQLTVRSGKVFSWPPVSPAPRGENTPFMQHGNGSKLRRAPRANSRPKRRFLTDSCDTFEVLDLDEGNDDESLEKDRKANGARGENVDDYEDYEDEEEDMQPYDSLRHKSIRRGILERLKFGSLRRIGSLGVGARTPELEKGTASVKAPTFVSIPVRTPTTTTFASSSSSEARGNSGSSPSLRRMKHTRADSDIRVDGLPRTPEISYACGGASRLVSGNRNCDRSGDGDDRGRDETEWVAGSGFRIIEERLEEMKEEVRTGRFGDCGGKTLPESVPLSSSRSRSRVEPGDARDVEKTDIEWSGDKYTPAPIRNSPSRTSRSRVSSSRPRPWRAGTSISVYTPGSMYTSISDEAFTSTRTPSRRTRGPVSVPPTLPRVDSSILPRSPPQITSPQLDYKLLFTPSLDSSESGYYFGGRTSMPPPLPLSGSRNRRGVSSVGTKTKTGGKTRTGTVHKSLPPIRDSDESRDGTNVDVRKKKTPAERHAARQGALVKVDEILLRSWSEREMGGGLG